jgi:NitT/TauT family transport system permease protein
VGSEVKLPAPLAVAKTFLRLAGTLYFWQSLGATLLRVLCSFLLGMCAGTLLGTLCAFLQPLDAFLSPLRNIIKATPVTSFIILVLLWLSNSLTPLFIAFLMVLPIAWINTQEAVRAVDAQLLEMADVFHLSLWDRIRRIYLPSMRPQYLAACTTALGFAWKSGVAAEVISTPALSIGRNLMQSKVYLESAELFAWTAAVILLSVLLEKLIIRLLKEARA